MKNIYIETYGCSANINNSEILAGLLTQAGYNITNNQDIADTIILNTCIVKGKTENKIKRRIQDVKKSNKLIIITGCMPETDAKQIKQLNPNTILLGTHHFKEIIKLLKDYFENKLTDKRQQEYLSKTNEEKLNLPKKPQNQLISIIQISEGCLGNCTFCKTKLAKGKLYSYSQDKILSSIKNDLQQGAKEIWITSQDCASYGMDKSERNLPELIKKIILLPHKFKLRLGMMNPNYLYPILDEMIEIYQSPKIYKFLHIPIQSASDKILKDMKRQYKIKKVEEIIKRFRTEFPDITIATDIIIGYPTETSKDFQESLNFIKTYKPDVFNLSKFSSHKGTEIYKQLSQGKVMRRKPLCVLAHKQTEACSLKELPIEILNKRNIEIMKLHQETALQNKQKFKDKTIKVLINKKLSGNLFEARDDNYNIILISSSDKTILGKTKQVKIEQVGVHHMVGEII